MLPPSPPPDPSLLSNNPAWLVTLLFAPLIYAVVLIVLLTDFSSDIKAMVVGVVVSGTLGGIVAYWIGSSSGSARKTEANLNMLKQQDIKESNP